MASSQRLLRRLGGLGRQLFSSTSTTGETMQSALADLTLLPADTGKESMASDRLYDAAPLS